MLQLLHGDQTSSLFICKHVDFCCKVGHFNVGVQVYMGVYVDTCAAGASSGH